MNPLTRLSAALLCGAFLSPCLLAAEPAPAAQTGTAKAEEPETTTPWYLRWMIQDTKAGMLVKIPIIDSDPNRGTTVGFMPIWINKKAGTDKIQTMHAPSITYNKVFGPVPTYRFYYYPTEVSTLHIRLAESLQIEREALIMYEDERLFGKELRFFGKLQYNIDGGRRFFGIGPDTPKKRVEVLTPNAPYDLTYRPGTGESNYAEDYILVNLSAGVPIRSGSKWWAHGYNYYTSWKTWNGKVPNLPAFFDTYPGWGPKYRQQTEILGAKLEYDTRDHSVTPSHGEYLKFYAETSAKGFLSVHDFQRYGVDARILYPYDPDGKRLIAFQAKFDQALGNPPFWFQPGLGGKWSLRAYGEGRYIERGTMVFNVEHRINLWSVQLAGVETIFELTPFAGTGTVFHGPERMAAKYFRPVFGLGGRAVAKPQVVGCVDFGYGQEGLAAFVDINYAF
ncbi:MAG: BamA/TamA family outer membrane protein [Elusimicrobia bacterium]|nr:BamA/TamA family outer membrane protein [Elusimicrobiota bacterium]